MIVQRGSLAEAWWYPLKQKPVRAGVAMTYEQWIVYHFGVVLPLDVPPA